jgi:hypothetical protein
MTPQAWQIHLALGLCRGGRLLVLASLVLTALAFSGTWLYGPASSVFQQLLVSLATLMLLPVLYLGLRLEIDRGLFQRLAQAQDSLPQDLDSLDTALAELGWKPTPAQPRPLADRVAGLARLTKGLGGLVVAQLLMLILANLAG